MLSPSATLALFAELSRLQEVDQGTNDACVQTMRETEVTLTAKIESDYTAFSNFAERRHASNIG